MEIKFETDDDLPLSRILNIPLCVILVKSAAKEDNRYYPQVSLHECLYEYKYEESTSL